jgi:RNA polymerase sigma-70 factor (ECF subfamily)
VDDAEAMLITQVKSNSRLFFRLAYGVVRDVQAAEDVCQQAFLQAWQLRDRLREPSALRAWLCKVVINEGLRVVRRSKVEERAKDRCAGPGGASMEPCDQAEFRARFQDALGQLPEQTRMVVVLRLVEGMSGNEVKSLLGCSASEVSRRLHQGMELLRTALAGPYAPD